MDLTGYTDEGLDKLRVDVLTEQERRTRKAAIPAQIEQLATAYVEAGGSRDDLPDVKTEPTPEPAPDEDPDVEATGPETPEQ